MKIAVIDTGIDKHHPKLQGVDVTGISIRKKADGWCYDSDFNDSNGHGTGCASIIIKHKNDVELVAVKIYHDDLLTTEDTLIEAFRWILSQPDIKLINVSLGCSGSANERLAEICRQLYQNNRIIVAACSNEINTKDYPAEFPTVFGVQAGQLKRGDEYGYSDDGYFIAKGSVQRVAWAEGRSIITSGTSYAAPHLVGIIAGMLTQEPELSPEAIRCKLITEARNNVRPIQFLNSTSLYKKPIVLNNRTQKQLEKSMNPVRNLSWIGRTAIFPASEKEMKQFIDFPHLAVFPVVMKFDYPRTFSTLNTSETLRTFHREIPTEEQFEQFETLIVGYFYDNLWQGNIVFGNKLVDEALLHGKNLFVYDPRVAEYAKQRISELNIKYKPHIYHPKVTSSTFKQFSCCEFLPNVNCPVLMVIGTGNRQGKFTTQLRLREILHSEGYRTAFIATEPHGELFGANFVYPYGYRSTISLGPIERLTFLRNLNKAVSHFFRPHLIISGTQGSVLPENPLSGTPYLGSIDAITNLSGLLPDLESV